MTKPRHKECICEKVYEENQLEKMTNFTKIDPDEEGLVSFRNMERRENPRKSNLQKERIFWKMSFFLHSATQADFIVHMHAKCQKCTQNDYRCNQ